MKNGLSLLFAIAIAICAITPANAQSTAAYENSACRASFDRTCYAEESTDTSIASTTVEAPGPMVGTTILGFFVFGLSLMALYMRNSTRRHMMKRALSASDEFKKHRET